MAAPQFKAGEEVIVNGKIGTLDTYDEANSVWKVTVTGGTEDAKVENLTRSTGNFLFSWDSVLLCKLKRCFFEIGLRRHSRKNFPLIFFGENTLVKMVVKNCFSFFFCSPLTNLDFWADAFVSFTKPKWFFNKLFFFSI